jgi:hypothetical protein
MISKCTALLEPASIFAMILLYIWRWRPSHPWSWALILGLVLASHAVRGQTAVNLGFRLKNFKSAAVALGPAVLALAAALLTIGSMCHTIRPVTPQAGLASLALYCCWGLFQQYLLNGYFLNRFVEIFPAGAPLLAAVAFSGIHMPNWFLMVVTLFTGFVCAKVYLKFGNLYVLGLAHGIIGFLLYLCVPDTISHHLYVGPKWFA